MTNQDILSFLDDQDELRTKINETTDNVISKLNVDALIADPEKAINALIKKIVSSNKETFKKSFSNGEKLEKKL